MKLNELRVFNLVDTINRSNEVHLPNNYPMKVGGIELFKVTLYNYREPLVVESSPEKVDIVDICGIPLTEEWLVKLGFHIHSDYTYRNYIHPKKRFCISMYMGNEQIAGFEENGVCYWGDGYLTVRYVHQLQNLYFALTGEEL